MKATKKNAAKRKERVTETLPESVVYMINWILGAMVTVYTVLILGVLPLYFEEGYTHIGTDKSTFFRTATVHMAGFIVPTLTLFLIFSVVVAVDNKKKGKNAICRNWLNVVDWFAIAYGISVVFSYLCTDYKETALWGTTGWFMGMLPHLTLVSIYFLVSRFQMKAKWLLYLCVSVSAVTFALGCLNRFDVWPLPMENSGLPSYISTVGNINWYCGYIVSVLFVGVGLLWLGKGEKRWYTILLSAYSCLGFAALVTQGSDSGLVALAVIFVVMFIMSAKAEDISAMRRFWWLIILFSLACLVVLCIRLLVPGRINQTTGMMDLLTYSVLPVLMMAVAIIGWWYTGKRGAKSLWKGVARGLFVAIPSALVLLVIMITINTVNPGSLGELSHKSIFTFNDEWGSKRGATWRYGFAVFEEQDILHKLVGVGPDCMADYLYQGSSDELKADVEKGFKNLRLTNAHNEILTILVNEGILGAVAFSGMFFCLLWRLLRVFTTNRFAASCGLCMLAYCANNMWSFQQSLSVSTIFVIMGLGEYFLRSEEVKK